MVILDDFVVLNTNLNITDNDIKFIREFRSTNLDNKMIRISDASVVNLN